MSDQNTTTVQWSTDGNTIVACRGRCICHTCCIPYEGEGGPHCEDCEPDE